MSNNNIIIMQDYIDSYKNKKHQNSVNYNFRNLINYKDYHNELTKYDRDCYNMEDEKDSYIKIYNSYYDKCLSNELSHYNSHFDNELINYNKIVEYEKKSYNNSKKKIFHILSKLIYYSRLIYMFLQYNIKVIKYLLKMKINVFFLMNIIKISLLWKYV